MANATADFTLEGLPMRVKFEANVVGVVTRLVVHDAVSDRDIGAAKLPARHGVVSIYDIDTAITAAN